MSKEYGVFKVFVYAIIFGVFIVKDSNELIMVSFMLFWIVIELIIMNQNIHDK